MKTFYKVTGDKIEPVEAIRHTDKSVWLSGYYNSKKLRRFSRNGSTLKFFETRKEAANHIINGLEVEIEAKKRKLSSVKKRLKYNG